MDKETKKRVLKKYTFIALLLLAIVISILLMVRYNVEGETKMPFKLEKIIIKSSLDADSKEGENLWDLNLIQNNDVYIYIKKNENIETESKIKSVKIDKMERTNKNRVGNVMIFLPISNDIKTCFSESKENYFGKTIEYYASTIDNLEKREICQDGGLMALRISNHSIGEYIANEGDTMQYDGTLLKKAGIHEEDIKFTIDMDLILETTNDEKYKGTLSLSLPVENFDNRGLINKEITDFSNVVFKRSE